MRGVARVLPVYLPRSQLAVPLGLHPVVAACFELSAFTKSKSLSLCAATPLSQKFVLAVQWASAHQIFGNPSLTEKSYILYPFKILLSMVKLAHGKADCNQR